VVDPLCFRFGSIIAGALQSSVFGKKDKAGETKDVPRKNKHQRGSFSFQGGMQVLNHCANISPLRNLVLCLIRAIDHLNIVFILLIHIFHLICLTVYPAQTLTDTLCKELGKDDIKLNAKVLTLAYSHDGSSPSQNWSITCASTRKTQDVDAVIMTVSMVSLLFPFCSFPNTSNYVCTC